jgi:hypothetical protein
VDCFGRDGYFNFHSNHHHEPAWEYMEDRWKTAPVIVEFCAERVALGHAIPLQQVQEYHISLIGNGNFGAWDRLNEQKQENLILVGKTAGYRYQIGEFTAPELWEAGSTVRVETDWENVGVAPHYEHTQVLFRLYDPRHSQYIWEAKSEVNLRMLLPTGDRPFKMQDQLELAANIPPGIYPLHVIVIDPQGYRLPLKLAITGRQEDGSYVLGEVIVKAPVRSQ